MHRPTSVYPSSPRCVPDGMNGFIDYNELLRVDRNALHTTVFRASDRCGTKECDPLIEHNHAVRELNDFILRHDVYEWLLADENTRAFYNTMLEQF